MKRLVFLTLVLVFAGAHVTPAAVTRTVSAPVVTNLAGSGPSYLPAFSADGRYLAFLSTANDLVPEDDTGTHLDVFVRDLISGTTRLASVSTNGWGGANGNSWSPMLSSNGQFLVYVSEATNLAGDDTNNAADIFLRDMVSGTARRISAAGPITTNVQGITFLPASRHPRLTPDGRWVVFESLAKGFPAVPETSVLSASYVYAFDREAGVTHLVSINAQGIAEGASSYEPDISEDGGRVVFLSYATNLTSTAPVMLPDLYLREMATQTTRSLTGDLQPRFPTNAVLQEPVMSGNGRYVAVKVWDHSAGSMGLARLDLETGLNAIVHTNVTGKCVPSISRDGRFIAYETQTNVYRWDGSNGMHELISVSIQAGQPGNGASKTPVMSPDGQKIAFVSAATDLDVARPPATNNSVYRVYLRDMSAGSTEMISKNLQGDPGAADLESVVPAMNGTGTMVAFEGPEAITSGDMNQASDVFVRSSGGTLDLVSVRSPVAALARTGWGAAKANSGTVSANGRFIAYGNFAPDTTNNSQHVYLRDLLNGTIRQLDAPEFGSNVFWRSPALSANGRFAAFAGEQNYFYGIGTFTKYITWRDLGQDTHQQIRVDEDFFRPGAKAVTPSLSANGRWLAFFSRRSTGEFVPGIPSAGNYYQVFIRDCESGTNLIASLNVSGTLPGNGNSIDPVLSPDGEWVLFTSAGSNLTTNQVLNGTYLYVRHRASGITRSVTPVGDGTFYATYAGGAAFSLGDARYVISTSLISSGGPPHLAAYRYALATGSNQLVCSYCEGAVLDQDGRYAVYVAAVGTNGTKGVFRKDLWNGTACLVSSNATHSGPAVGEFGRPLITPDGRYAIFASTASDLVSHDTNGFYDIFLRDCLQNTTTLLSINHQGTAAGNRTSFNPVLGADGRTVLFQSMASDLVPADYNNQRDVFVVRLGSDDADYDTMDDDWEMAFFETLNRTGSEDFDGDGQSDAQEFIAGTDPTNQGSVLRVTSLEISGSVHGQWQAVPGKSYRVQYKDGLSDNAWHDLGVTRTATSATEQFIDRMGTGMAQRFYRVLVLP